VLRPELLNLLREPAATDDKYSRGVIGFVTGSMSFPGAAILGVTAAMRSGIGMVRYLGPRRVGEMLLEVRPEAVLVDGRAQAWVLGSGMAVDDDFDQLLSHFSAAEIAVVDAGALAVVDFELGPVRTVLTPHAGEASALLARLGHEASRADVESASAEYAALLAQLTGRTVLLKGNLTHLAAPDATTRTLGPLSADLATAGTGDVLAGILGALLAANHDRVIESQEVFLDTIELAVLLHSSAAELASGDGPVVALDVAEAIRKVISNQHD
jgi:hydroxyethylthiazole kinase-like uncharacterized protein yjeF